MENSDLLENNRQEKNISNLLMRWIGIKQSGRSIENFFLNNNYRSIAIYGFGDLGKLFFNELRNSKVPRIVAVIDKNVDYFNIDIAYNDVDFITPQEVFPSFDVMVIASVRSYSEMYSLVKDKCTSPIVSLEQVILDS